MANTSIEEHEFVQAEPDGARRMQCMDARTHENIKVEGKPIYNATRLKCMHARTYRSKPVYKKCMHARTY
ncbi:hypothetical protein KF728_24165 [Candidatus Obscuribacterales bacterium]|nr:hypothetical protein [Candidatus Obscuribacterales bacterium]